MLFGLFFESLNDSNFWFLVIWICFICFGNSLIFLLKNWGIGCFGLYLWYVDVLIVGVVGVGGLLYIYVVELYIIIN